MKQTTPDFKTKLIYGLFVLLPVAVIVVVLGKLIEALELIAKKIGLHTSFGAGIFSPPLLPGWNPHTY